jgi:hypothetical protein
MLRDRGWREAISPDLQRSRAPSTARIYGVPVTQVRTDAAKSSVTGAANSIGLVAHKAVAREAKVSRATIKALVNQGTAPPRVDSCKVQSGAGTPWR